MRRRRRLARRDARFSLIDVDKTSGRIDAVCCCFLVFLRQRFSRHSPPMSVRKTVAKLVVAAAAARRRSPPPLAAACRRSPHVAEVIACRRCRSRVPPPLSCAPLETTFNLASCRVAAAAAAAGFLQRFGERPPPVYQMRRSSHARSAWRRLFFLAHIKLRLRVGAAPRCAYSRSFMRCRRRRERSNKKAKKKLNAKNSTGCFFCRSTLYFERGILPIYATIAIAKCSI